MRNLSKCFGAKKDRLFSLRGGTTKCFLAGSVSVPRGRMALLP